LKGSDYARYLLAVLEDRAPGYTERADS